MLYKCVKINLFSRYLPFPVLSSDYWASPRDSYTHAGGGCTTGLQSAKLGAQRIVKTYTDGEPDDC